MTDLEPFKVSLKVYEDTVIRRIDRLIYKQSDPSEKNTLKDLKVIDNSAILVEERDQNEIEENDTQQNNNGGQVTNEDTVITIDDTENIRTVIVNKESDKSNFDRY